MGQISRIAQIGYEEKIVMTEIQLEQILMSTHGMAHIHEKDQGEASMEIIATSGKKFARFRVDEENVSRLKKIWETRVQIQLDKNNKELELKFRKIIELLIRA